MNKVKYLFVLSLAVMMTACLIISCTKDDEETPSTVRFYDTEIPYRQIDRNTAPDFLVYLMESENVLSIYQANLNGETIYAYFSAASLCLALPSPFYLDANGNSITFNYSGYQIYEMATDWVCIFWDYETKGYWK